MSDPAAALAHQNDFDVCWCKGSVADCIFQPLIQRIQQAGGRIVGGQFVTNVQVSTRPRAEPGGWLLSVCIGPSERQRGSGQMLLSCWAELQPGAWLFDTCCSLLALSASSQQ